MANARIAIQNLGKYNEGELVFEWLTLPATEDEIAEALERIGVAPGTRYEEYEIADWENIDAGRFSSINELNDKAEAIERLVDEYNVPRDMVVELIKENDEDTAEEIIEDAFEIEIVDGTSIEAHVGEYFANMDGTLDRLEEVGLAAYFDNEAYGRDMLMDFRIIHEGIDRIIIASNHM